MSDNEREQPEIGDWQVPARMGLPERGVRKSTRDHSHSHSVVAREHDARLKRQRLVQDENDAYYQHASDWKFPRRYK